MPLPPWMVKSSTGTELATWPMCVKSSSFRPVEGQVMLRGWPSRVKKPAAGGLLTFNNSCHSTRSPGWL